MTCRRAAERSAARNPLRATATATTRPSQKNRGGAGNLPPSGARHGHWGVGSVARVACRAHHGPTRRAESLNPLAESSQARLARVERRGKGMARVHGHTASLPRMPGAQPLPAPNYKDPEPGNPKEPAMSTESLSGLDWRGIALILTLVLALVGGLIWLLRQNRADRVDLEETLAQERAADERAEDVSR